MDRTDMIILSCSGLFIISIISLFTFLNFVSIDYKLNVLQSIYDNFNTIENTLRSFV